jgi:hypothetical protein
MRGLAYSVLTGADTARQSVFSVPFFVLAPKVWMKIEFVPLDKQSRRIGKLMEIVF